MTSWEWLWQPDKIMRGDLQCSSIPSKWSNNAPYLLTLQTPVKCHTSEQYGSPDSLDWNKLKFYWAKRSTHSSKFAQLFFNFFLFQSSFFSGCTYACTDTQDDMKHYLEVLFKFTLHNSIDVQLKNYLTGFVTFHALTLYGQLCEIQS